MSIMERLQARKSQLAANNSKGLRPYKIQAGITKFRILPDVDPNKNFDRDYGKHYLKSLDGKKLLGVLDKKVSYDQDDFVRDLLFDAMRQAGDETIRNHYRDMMGSNRAVFRALILNDPNVKPTEAQIIEVSQTQVTNIYGQLMVWLEAEGDDYDALQHVFQVEKSGSGMDTKYQFSITPVKAPVTQAIIDAAPDLDAWIAGQDDKSVNEIVNFLAQVHSTTGITLDTSYIPQQLGGPAPTAALVDQTVQAAQQAVAQAQNPANISSAAVTQILEDDPQASVELNDTVPFQTDPVDAVIEEIAAEVAEAPAEVVAEPATTPAAEPAPAPAPAAEADNTDDIAAVLAMLNE